MLSQHFVLSKIQCLLSECMQVKSLQHTTILFELGVAKLTEGGW